MSKVDAQRAMRDARIAAFHAARAAGGAKPAPAPAAPARKVEPAAAPVAELALAEPAEADPAPELSVIESDDETSEAQPALCGHRSIGNKSCTRPAGHPEKNHRYK